MSPGKSTVPTSNTCRCRRGLATTPCSSARLPLRSRSRERSIWSSRRRQSSCWCGSELPRTWSKTHGRLGMGPEPRRPRGKGRPEARSLVSHRRRARPALGGPDVHQVEVRVPKDSVDVRKDRPKSWSVVHEPHLVCPGCHKRQYVSGQPKEVKCHECGNGFAVDWQDRA